MTYDVHGVVCLTPVYEYKGWIFEYSPNIGVWPLKKNLEPRKRAGKVFWGLVGEFLQLPDSQQAACRVGGGCIHF